MRQHAMCRGGITPRMHMSQCKIRHSELQVDTHHWLVSPHLLMSYCCSLSQCSHRALP
jgi:hypothetical protein